MFFENDNSHIYFPTNGFVISKNNYWKLAAGLVVDRDALNSPTELAMRGSDGVDKEGGYESWAAPVAQPVVVFFHNLHNLVTPTFKNIS